MACQTVSTCSSTTSCDFSTVRFSSSVRCVLFDAVGTLIYADPPVSAVYAAAARDFGLVLDKYTVQQRFADAFAKHYQADDSPDRQRTSQAQEVERWRSIVAAVFPEFGDCEALFQRLWDHFTQPASWRPYDDVVACWRRLMDRGLKLGVASNFDDRLLSICRGLAPFHESKYVFLSSRLGYRKPALHFFRAIEKATKLGPNELLLIGDDWENDFLAAKSAGWQANYLDRTNTAATTIAIRSLAEIT